MNKGWKMSTLKSLLKNRKLLLLISLLLISTFLAFYLYRNIAEVKAAERTWIQTNWRAGSVPGVITENQPTFNEEVGVDYSSEESISIQQTEGWQLNNWLYRREIQFSDILEEGYEELTDIAIPVKLEKDITIDYSKAQSNGEDIRFLKTDDTELVYEIDIWDTEGDSYIWILLPTILSGEDEFMYMYYGNSSASDPEYGVEVKRSSCIGGNQTTSGTSYYHEFLEDSIFSCSQDINADVLVVAGGGGGGYRHGAGGGGGGVIFESSYSVLSDTSLTVTVGSGGVGSTGRSSGGESGENSLFDSLEAIGGGGGGQYDVSREGLNGGSGGGSASRTRSLGTVEQGYDGGINTTNGSPYNHGGGGGAGEVGGDGTAQSCGDGGDGIYIEEFAQFGEEGYFGGGGGGGSHNPMPTDGLPGEGGLGGGGDSGTPGVNTPGEDGLEYTGGGGGGAATSSGGNSRGGNGGSGVVLVKVPRTGGTFLSPQDEVRKLSETAYLVSNVFDTGYPTDWDELTYTESGQGTVEVRIRTDVNETMNSASEWTGCNPISSGSLISLSSCVENEDRYVQYKISFEADLVNTPFLDDISISFSPSDQTPPEENATALFMSGLVENDQWVNIKPTINWTEGIDNDGGNGIEGYCISLDEVNPNDSSQSLDPVTSSGVFTGLDDGIENDSSCPYIVGGNSINLAEIDGLNLQSNKKYFFSIKTVDLAGNVWAGDSQYYQDLVWFKYDITIPSNVMYISTPSTDFGYVNDMFFNWPITGSSQAIDNESGILGWQYAVNSSESSNWKGTETHPKLGVQYIAAQGSAEGLLNLNTERDGDLPIGNNTIYFRAIDAAGNVSTYVTGGINYGGAAPEFPEESVVTIDPTVSISNSFSLSWPEAIPGDGDEIDSYYYMINTQPPSGLSTLRANSNIYIPTTGLSVDENKLLGAVKGINNVYVVAVDNEDNYSPTKAIHGSFELNSLLPDPPLAVSTADLSIKDSELWRVAITWEEPIYKGNGNLTYIIERSGNNVTWVEIDRTSGLSYTDIVPESKTYYYKVATIDTSNESIASPSYSSIVQLHPKGRYEEPPELISDPIVTEITTRYAKINWATDRVSDSKVQLGISSSEYFQDEMYRSDIVTGHEIELTNLSPGTQYYFRVKWTDEDGNTGVSSESIFQTKPAPVVEDVQVDSVGLNYAIFKLTTTGATKARIVYGRTKTYGGSQEINTSTASSEYSVMLTELEDGTEYHYKIVLTDEEGFEYESFEDHLFSTPPRPQVSNVQIQEKQGVATPTIEVFWESNIEINSIVKYSSNGKSLDKVDMELIEGEHVMEVSGLDPNSEYQLTVEGVDSMGNRAVSDVYAFTTATDTRPPEVSSIKSEGDIQSSDIQSDRTRSAQLIISWETDEPSSSQILYGEGAASDGFPYSTQTDSQMRYEHVLIVSNLSPSKVYHFKVVSKDSAGNVGESGSVTSITPKSTDTVMESVLGSLGRIFNFL